MAKKYKHDNDVAQSADISTWSTWSNLVAWFFYRVEHWDANDISYYNEVFNTYYQKYLVDFENELAKQKDRVLQYVQDEKFLFLDDVIFDKPCVRAGLKENSFEYQIGLRQTEINNIYSRQHFRFWLAHYNAMIDLGFSKEDLIDHNVKVEEMRTAYYNRLMDDIFTIHKKLLIEVGIDLALPTEEQMRERAAM